ncbi:hypothetical protein [Leifsonia sp. LS-T14]|uniref:hypothetical protein n=1 Tax=unclassified Leifsonia TaxID=2663824 RepID=UPI0035A5F564
MSLTIGLILTAMLVVASLLWIMFSTHPGDPRASGFFGAVFFEVREKAGGALAVGAGLGDVLPLVVAFVALSALTFAVAVITAKLQAYKRALMHASDT